VHCPQTIHWRLYAGYACGFNVSPTNETDIDNCDWQPTMTANQSGFGKNVADIDHSKIDKENVKTTVPEAI
jgi:hypothetical protein